MNERLRSILHTAWNEPRHFFFWLAMLSLGGSAAIALGIALTGPSLLLAFVGLGCVLCFLLSIPAFILAWIPPVRRLLSRLLRWRFLALGCLVTLVALFYAVENWRGRRAWQSYKRTQEAKGEQFDLARLAPPPVPADQNFFETPLWSDLHFVETNGAAAWGHSDGDKRVIFSIAGPEGANVPSTGHWLKAQRVDLLAWQAFYRGTNNLFAALSGPPTNYFPIAKEPQTPAADVLLALSKFETNRQLLIAAAARPQARFWINYDAGFAMVLPHLARLKAGAQYLSLHATAALKAGDHETALQDVQLTFRLIESVRDQPVLISYLVRIAALQLALQPVWEGLADRQWADAELSEIEQTLGKLDLLSDLQFALRGERACGVWAVDYVRRRGLSELDGMFRTQDEALGPERWEQSLGRAMFRLIPAGWFDQNKRSICRITDQYLLPMMAQADRRVVPLDTVQRLDAGFQRWRPRLYDMLAGLLMPAYGRTVEKSALAQGMVDLARVAGALERYRLLNGQFPETLEALAPKFIAALPHDVVNGQPLKYRRTDDGQFVLYSVGLDQTDDGGKIALNKSGNFDWKDSDWVWRYPAR